MTPRILIVAGSDSGGGAGIQADVKTVTMLGGHAMTAITAITAQNTLGVQGVHPVPAEMVVAQMRSCIDDIGVDAVKIGMIGSAETAQAVAEVLEALNPLPSGERESRAAARERGRTTRRVHPTAPLPSAASGGSLPLPEGERGMVPIVLDPVMVATSGSVLADAATIAAFDRLMRVATLVTPNAPELDALGGADAILATGALVLAKGGHLEGETVIDRLLGPDGEIARWENPRIHTRHTHGTGCTLASAIATGLGTGLPLADATGRAIAFVRASLAAAPGLGAGHGPMGQQYATGFACPA
ncbi:hydroxymethylpyrimidine/phosphomethylpyrimidine kinase [Sphingomonas sp.]|uniref:bifunctional hydroxymethylpyrimidine kinase/phosphomethylpyrimidine kinase n=1 Tax=Sphingomonas sp. TaxID=28214 RepID=UPI0035C869CA